MRKSSLASHLHACALQLVISHSCLGKKRALLFVPLGSFLQDFACNRAEPCLRLTSDVCEDKMVQLDLWVPGGWERFEEIGRDDRMWLNGCIYA